MEASTRTFNAQACVLCIAMIIMAPSIIVSAKGPKSLEVFVHETRTSPASLILVAPVAGPLTNRQFGSIIVIDNALRTANTTDSELLGRQLGQVAVGSDNIAFFVSYTFLFNTTSFPGSITVAGILQSGALVVTGGTGTFAFARGIATPLTVADTGVAAVYKYSLSLKY